MIVLEYYQIAGLGVRLSGNGVDRLGIFREQLMKFASDKNEISDLCIQIVLKENIQAPPEKLMLDEYTKWSIKQGGGYNVFCVDQASEKIFILVKTDEYWKNVIVQVCGNLPGYSNEKLAEMMSESLFFMLGLVFRNTVILHDGFVIHSSSIDYAGHGIIFSAPSGTGKSTHVNLWNTYYAENCHIINDDTPPIRIINDVPYLFGSPWCGSSFKGINASVKLSAMVAIERGQTNVIRQLDYDEALPRLVPRMSLPLYCESLMDLAIKTFEKVLLKVPSYLLSCTIDRQAVEVVRACVK